MKFYELILIAVGLSMDAFAVAMCKGLAWGRADAKKGLVVGLWFGFFQAAMPVAGFFLGRSFEKYITAVDHWIAFGLLVIIGGKMIREAFSSESCDSAAASLRPLDMLAAAVATSIDALAVGISFAFLRVDIWPAAAAIGITTLALSFAGALLGSLLGARYRRGAQVLGGVILILIGLKILLEHLGVIGF